MAHVPNAPQSQSSFANSVLALKIAPLVMTKSNTLNQTQIKAFANVRLDGI